MSYIPTSGLRVDPSASHQNPIDFSPKTPSSPFTSVAQAALTGSVQEVTPSLEQRDIKPASGNNYFMQFCGKVKSMQDGIDNCGSSFENAIRARFDRLKEMTGWNTLDASMTKAIDANWLVKFLNTVVQLPIKSVKKILNQFYNLIKSILHAIVHPVQGVEKLARMFLNLIRALITPETWTSMGGGMIGASLGTAAMGNPVSVIGVTIGAAAIAAGLTLGSLKAALSAYKKTEDQGAYAAMHAAINNLGTQLSELPQAVSDGILMAIIMGGIQKIAKKYQDKTIVKEEQIHTQVEVNRIKAFDRFPSNADPKKYIDTYIDQNNLPKEYTNYAIDSANGNIHIYYENAKHLKNMQANPKIAEIVARYATDPMHRGFKPINIEVVLGPNARVAIHAHTFWSDGAPFWPRDGINYDVAAFNPNNIFVADPTKISRIVTSTVHTVVEVKGKVAPIIAQATPFIGGAFAALKA